MPAQAFYSPDGNLIIGTAEKLFGTARIAGVDPATGQPVYSGGTDVDWDSQETLISDGKILFVCDSGFHWTFDQLVAEELQFGPSP